MRVLYPGAFDLIHPAHITALQTARRIAGPTGTLMVGVNSDALMRHYKRDPMHTAKQRIYDVMETGIADQVFKWDGPEGQDLHILASRPDVYIAGTDWLSKDLAHQLRLPSLAWFDEHSISLMFLRRTPGISTTQLIEARHGKGEIHGRLPSTPQSMDTSSR